MIINKTADYRIYFDDVRVDPYVVSWNTTLGLNAGEAMASVTMFKSEALSAWKAYLTHVRIFAKNIFSGKYTMVFHGEITDRTWEDSRADSGKVSFTIQGFFHWLMTPLAVATSNQDSMVNLKTFEFGAAGINPIESLQAISETTFLGKNVETVIQELLTKMNNGFYGAIKNDSSFGWADIEQRFQVLSEIDPSVREVGFLYYTKLEQNTKIDTFFVYLNEMLMEMMMEFYQARDGHFYIKQPFWGESILKTHILDESLIASINGLDAWSNEPTRVLAQGALTDASRGSNTDLTRQMSMPMALYLSDPDPVTEKDRGRFYTLNAYEIIANTGLDPALMSSVIDENYVTSDWYDNVTSLRVTGIFNEKRTKDNGGVYYHQGVDFAMVHGTELRSLGTKGIVTNVSYSDTQGYFVDIEQTINGKNYRFRYLHMSRQDVKNGQTVEAGQVIGLSGGDPTKSPIGKAGRSTGAHLHLELYDFAKKANIDPVVFLNTNRQSLRKNLQIEVVQGARYQDSYTSLMLSNTYNFVTSINEIAAQLSINQYLARAYVSRVYQLFGNPQAFDKYNDYKKYKDSLFERKEFLASVLAPLADEYPTIVQKPSLMIKSLTNALKMTGVSLNRPEVYTAFGTSFSQSKMITIEQDPSSSANDILHMYKILINDYKVGTGVAVSASTNKIVAAIKPQSTPYATIDKAVVNKRYDYKKDLHLLEVADNFAETIQKIKRQSALSGADQNPITSQWYEFEATAYDAFCDALPGYQACSGKTAAGIDVSDNTRYYNIIAVDPSIIPLYTMVEVECDSKDIPGGRRYFQAMDTGGAIDGRHIDILVKTKQEALNFGRQRVRLRIVHLPGYQMEYTKPKSKESVKKTGITPSATAKLVRNIPTEANAYKTLIANNGKVDPNLLAAVISVVSNWKARFSDEWTNANNSKEGLYGLTGMHSNLFAGVELTTSDVYRPELHIPAASSALSQFITNFNGHVSFALAAYFTGQYQKVQEIKSQAAQVRQTMNPSLYGQNTYVVDASLYLTAQSVLNQLLSGGKLVTLIESVINDYLAAVNATHINGDPITSSDRKGPWGVANYDVLFPEVSIDLSADTDVKKFAFPITDEERKYKLNLKRVVQTLLRYDGQNSQDVVDNLVKKYAQYMMQVFRAQSHTASVNLMTCLPFINPGFNVWIEPSRTDVIGYVTKVVHQATYGQGCYTSVQVEFIRQSDNYNDVVRETFYGSHKISASDFGPVVSPLEISTYRAEVLKWHEDNVHEALDSFNAVQLQKMYASGSVLGKDVSEWNAEYTSAELDTKIKTLYAAAPSIITERKNKWASVIDESKAFFLQKLFLEYTQIQ